MAKPRKPKVPDPNAKPKEPEKPLSIEDQIRFNNPKSTFVQGGRTRHGIVQ